MKLFGFYKQLQFHCFIIYFLSCASPCGLHFIHHQGAEKRKSRKAKNAQVGDDDAGCDCAVGQVDAAVQCCHTLKVDVAVQGCSTSMDATVQCCPTLVDAAVETCAPTTPTNRVVSFTRQVESLQMEMLSMRSLKFHLDCIYRYVLYSA